MVSSEANNFHPNAAAHTLADRRSQGIGLVAPQTFTRDFAAVEPPLTAVSHPIDQVGFLAASTWIDLLESASFETGGNGARRIVLPTELVVRVSCGHVLRFTAGAQTPTRHHW